MKRVVLNTSAVKEISQLHDELARVLKFPNYYGKNLDALYDCLTSDLKLPCLLIWKNYPAAFKSIGEPAKWVLDTLKAFAEEEPEFKLEVE